LRNLKRSDYSVTAGVRGALFGTPYSIGAFAPTSASRIVPGNGRVLSNREGYWQDSVTVEADVAGRLGRRLRFKAWGAFMDWREWFDDPQRAVQDPTQLDAEPMQDEGILVARSSGVLRDVFVNARWTAGGSLAAELPRALHAGLIVHARDGFPIPYFQVASTGDPTAGGKNVLVAPNLDSYRLPAVVLVDLRLARDFPVRGGRLTAAVDAFNVLNRATTLQVVRDVELPAFNRPQDIVRPRLFRLGLEYRF
jgi:hypothetical protein